MDRSPISISDTPPRISRVPCRNRVGPSMATAPPMVTVRVPRCRSTAMNAATTAISARLSWIVLRDLRGVNPSTRTPTHATAKRINMGARAP